MFVKFSPKWSWQMVFIVFCCIFQIFRKIFCKIKKLSYTNFYRNLVTWSGLFMALRNTFLSWHSIFSRATFASKIKEWIAPRCVFRSSLRNIWRKVIFITWTHHRSWNRWFLLFRAMAPKPHFLRWYQRNNFFFHFLIFMKTFLINGRKDITPNEKWPVANF